MSYEISLCVCIPGLYPLVSCVNALLNVCACVAVHHAPSSAANYKGFQPFCLPLTCLLPEGGRTDDTGESTAGAASHCTLCHPSLKKPGAGATGRPLPVIRQAQVGSERFFDGLVAVLWLIALRPKLAPEGL